MAKEYVIDGESIPLKELKKVLVKWNMHPLEFMPLSNPKHPIGEFYIYNSDDLDTAINQCCDNGWLNDIDYDDLCVLKLLMGFILLAMKLESQGDSKSLVKFLDEFNNKLSNQLLMKIDLPKSIRESMGTDEKQYNKFKDDLSVIAHEPVINYQNINTYLDRKIAGFVNACNDLNIIRARQIDILLLIFISWKFDGETYYFKYKYERAELRKKIGERIDDVRKKYPY